MPASLALIHLLRAAGLAAVVSGAGPTVLVLGVGADAAERVGAVAAFDGPAAWQVVQPGVDLRGAHLVAE